MSEQCNNSCDSCKENCGERKKTNTIEKDKPLNGTKIKKVIAVMSGKGGVGKSLVTSLLAANMKKRGFNVSILDADITGPSIPKIFGVHQHAASKGKNLLPVSSKGGIDLMSINLLLEKETEAVIWRGPVIAGVVKQFWSQVEWGDVDYMFIDMPPGTGDVPLTVFQSIPVDGVVLVTTPQDLVSMIVEKAVSMTSLMNIPVLGLISNMSYFICPDCSSKHKIFGDSSIEEKAQEHGIPILADLPIDPNVAKAADSGTIEDFKCTWMDDACDKIQNLPII